MSKIVTEVEALDLLSQLGQELVTSYEAENATVATIVAALIGFQVLTPAITVGTISGDYSGLTRSIKVDGDTILRALFRLRDTVGGYIYVDNDRKLQWANSLGEDKGQQIRYRKNLKGIERNIDYNSLINRLYCYGEGEGSARIKLSDAVGQAEDYVEDVTSQGAPPDGWGGIYVGIMVDRSITHPDTLLAWANLMLAEVKDPLITYAVDTLGLSMSTETSFSFDSLQLGSTVTVIDEDLGIDVSVRVVKIEHPDLHHPEQMNLELATRIKDITDTLSGVYDVQQLTQHIATVIGAGNVIVKGTFTVLDWATEGETTIRGDYITTGTIVLGALNFIPLTSSGETGAIIATINATAEGIKISAEKIDIATPITVFRQDGIPTSTAVGDLWFDTNDTNKLYRAAMVGANEIKPGEWELVTDTDIATNTASIVVTETNIALNVTAISNNEDDIITNTGNITINADAITLEVTNRTNADNALQGSITVNAGNIALKVSKNDVINQINISTEGIKIDADNITLDGVVAVTDDIKSSNYSIGVAGWIIDGDGNAEFNDLTVRGDIHAEAGSEISAGYITTGTIEAKTITIKGATGIIKSDNYSAGTLGWQIEGDGDAEFNNVTVRGAVYATSGEFTGTLKVTNIEAGKTLTVNGAISVAGGDVILDSNGIRIYGDLLGFFISTTVIGSIYPVSTALRIQSSTSKDITIQSGDDMLVSANNGSLELTASADIEIDPWGNDIRPGTAGVTDIGTDSDYFDVIECVTLDDAHSPAPAILKPLEVLRRMSTKHRTITLKEADKEHLGKRFRRKIEEAGGTLEFDEKDKSTFPLEILNIPIQANYDKAERVYQQRLNLYAKGIRARKPIKGVPVTSTSVFDEVWLLVRAVQELADKVDELEVKIG